MEEKDLNKLHKWFNQPDDASSKVFPFEEEPALQRAFDHIGKWRVPGQEEKAKQDSWAAFEKKIAPESGSQSPQSTSEGKVVSIGSAKNNQWWYAAASLLLAGMAAAYFLVFSATVVETQLAQTQVHQLPDGSTVTLNSASKISYVASGWEDERTLQLDGEAFFEVKKGSTFSVKTSNGTVTVLGTSFNVYSRKSSFEVACKTGKVRVENKALSAAEILIPGEKVTLLNESLQKGKTSEMDLIGSWMRGEFHFTAIPVKQLFEEVERQFGVEISSEVNANEQFTGYFYKENLTETLEMICGPMGYDFEVQGKKVTISAK